MGDKNLNVVDNLKIDLAYSPTDKHFYENNQILNELVRCKNTNHRKKMAFSDAR